MGVRRPLIVAALALAAAAPQAGASTLSGPVRYAKAGGFAGILQRMTIRRDGTGVTSNHSDKRKFRLPENRLRSLKKLVKAADIAHTKSPKPGQGADAIGYSVAYRGHTVTWSDLSANPPRRILKLYELLDQIYEKY